MKHHFLCATNRGSEYWCDCILWNGSSRFAPSTEDLFKFATNPVDTTKPLNLDLVIQGDWYISLPLAWYWRAYYRIWRWTILPVKRWWWRLTE